MEGSDVCFAPMLSLTEAPGHAQVKARGTFVEVDGLLQPGPTPRFGRTRPEIRGGPAVAGRDTDAVLADFGFAAGEIAELRRTGVIGAAQPSRHREGREATDDEGAGLRPPAERNKRSGS